MSEPSDPREKTQVNPHPVSEHRTPREIAADEVGPIGKPDPDVVSKSAADPNPKRYPAARRPNRPKGDHC
jgi:hypothetical protein